MDRREMNIEIYRDTMAWMKENPELSAAVKSTQNNTVLYMPGCFDERQESKKKELPGHGHTEIEVTSWRSFAAAVREKENHPEACVSVLNFASATNPGGGVTRGSSAQEEALCRCSTLYPCLNTKELWDSYYGFHRGLHDTRYTDACIYTPGVLVIKSDTNFPERLPENQWVKVDVISCAAPNLREKPYNAMNPGSGERVNVTDKELLELHKSRGRQIMKTAAVNGTDILILGAFGCGAFQNNPEVVARAYKEILPEFHGWFKKVHFAVYCSPGDMRNYDVFMRQLGVK